MKEQSLFRRYFFVTVITFAIVIIVASITSLYLRSFDHKRIIEAGPFYFARLLSEQKKSRVEVVQSLNRVPFFHPLPGKDPQLPPFELDLIDSTGKSLVTGQQHWPASQIKLTQNVLESQRLEDQGRPEREMVIKLDKETDQYLLASFHPRDNPFPRFFTINLMIMVFGTLLASAVSAYLLLQAFRQKAVLAEKVIVDLQHGDLKSRFPVSRIDEFTHVMVSFNKMADEIERLVSSLKENEKERIALLQELAHDLRTPVASLKNLMETFKDRYSDMSSDMRDEVLSLSLEEIKYFERLVEDLLFLGQVMEPKYHAQSSDVDFAELLEDQINVMKKKYPHIRVVENFQARGAEVLVLGDEQLLRRLIRNGLENSFSFAKSEVEIDLQMQDAKTLQMKIRDNGPGLSAEALASFGKKRTTRMLKAEGQGRLSMGLGSVIMVTIAQLHEGIVRIQNHMSSGESAILGAELTVVFPIRKVTT